LTQEIDNGLTKKTGSKRCRNLMIEKKHCHVTVLEIKKQVNNTKQTIYSLQTQSYWTETKLQAMFIDIWLDKEKEKDMDMKLRGQEVLKH